MDMERVPCPSASFNSSSLGIQLCIPGHPPSTPPRALIFLLPLERN